jgi:signal peptide peptidase SppA
MDGLLQLVDAGAFQAYAARVAKNAHLKRQRMNDPQAFGGLGASDWFQQIKAYEEGHEFDRQGSVAVINIRGYLSYAYDFWTWWLDGCSYCGLMNKVTAAANDTSITKIILNVNSPGGGTIGVIEAADAIFAARAKKDVVSVINPEAASAGYWLAAQANRIVVMESGFVGSIGAEIDYQSVASWLKEEGIDVAVIRSEHAPDKNLGHRLEPISDRAKSYFQELCNQAGAKFIEHVARGRGVKEDAVIKTYGQGRMLFGSDAVRLGMADAIGNLADELATAAAASGSGMNAGRKYQGRAAADRSLRV